MYRPQGTLVLELEDFMYAMKPNERDDLPRVLLPEPCYFRYFESFEAVFVWVSTCRIDPERAGCS